MDLLTLKDIWNDMSLEQQDAVPRMLSRVTRFGRFDLGDLYMEDRRIYRQMPGAQRRLVDWMIDVALKSLKEV